MSPLTLFDQADLTPDGINNPNRSPAAVQQALAFIRQAGLRYILAGIALRPVAEMPLRSVGGSSIKGFCCTTN